MVLNNLIILHFTCIMGLGLFNIIMLLLNSLKALNFVSSHRKWLACLLWDVLNESYHSLRTQWVKLFIVTCLKWWKLSNSWWGSVLQWILGNVRLNVIAIVCDKSHSIIKLDIKRLVIDSGPMSFNYFGAALAAIFAEDGLDFIIVHDIHSINIELVKVKSVTSVY